MHAPPVLLEGGVGSSSQNKSDGPSQSCRVYFSVIEPRLRLFRFAVFTEVDLVPSALPALANVALCFHITYRQLGNLGNAAHGPFQLPGEGGVPPDWPSRMRSRGRLQTAVKIMSLQISRRQVLASGALPRRARHEVVRVQAHPSPSRAHCRVCWRHTACHGFNRSRNARLACSLALVPQSRRMYLTSIRPHLAGETKTNSNALTGGPFYRLWPCASLL